VTTYRKDVLHDAILMMFNPIIRITHNSIGTQVRLPNLENYINGKIKTAKDGESLARPFWESLALLPLPDGSRWGDYTPGGVPEDSWEEWIEAAARFDTSPDTYIAAFDAGTEKDSVWKDYFAGSLAITIKDLHTNWTRSNGWCDTADDEYRLMATKFRSTPAVSFD